MKTNYLFSTLTGLAGVLILAPALAQETAGDAAETAPSALVGSTADAGAGADEKADQGAAPAAGSRSNRINSIVLQALDSAPSASVVLDSTSTENAVPLSPPQQRRERLRNAVSNATESTAPGGEYVSILKDEGGKTVVIDEESAKQSAVAAPGGATAVVAVSRSIPSQDDGVRVHQVQAGDSLWLLAKRYYGNGFKYMSLYEANIDRLANENALEVGEYLRIP